MKTETTASKKHRARWAAIGAAVAVSLGAGGIGLIQATSPAGASAYVPITPCRLADTRPAPDNVGPKDGPLGGGDTHTFNGWASAGGTGDCDATDLPDGTTGLELNVTAVGPTQNTNLRFWPADETMPLASNLNPSVGQPATPNSVSVTLSPTGQFNVYNFQGNVNVVIDVVGHYTDHNHDDRYYTETEVDSALATKASRTETITVPAAAFRPISLSDVMVSDSFGAYMTDGMGTHPSRAPLDLPVGSTITSITYHYRDDAAGYNLSFDVARTALSAASQSFATDTFTTSGSPGFGSQTIDGLSIEVTNTHEFAIAAYAGGWHHANNTLTVKGVQVTYTKP